MTPREKAELALHDSLQRGDSIPEMVRVVGAELHPEKPEPERIEAMALAYSTDWDTATKDQRLWWRLKSREVYAAERKWIGL